MTTEVTMFRDDRQLGAAARTLLARVDRAGWWGEDGRPTPEACDLVEAGAGGLAAGERALLHFAFTLWNGWEAGRMRELLSLDAGNLAAVGSLLTALSHGRDDFATLRAWFADRGWCYGDERAPRRPASRRPLREPAPRPPKRPARTHELVDDVATLWRRCRPVTEDHQVRAWLEQRGLDPAKVEDRDLARALPRDLDGLPPWARARGRTWTAGWRCLLPAYAPGGRLESLRARWVRPEDPPHGLKAVATAAGAGSASGVMLADAIGVELLRTGEAPAVDKRQSVVVVEGGPDFLTWATRWSETDLTAPAVFGVWPGAWTWDIGGRVPRGTRVALRTHADKAGQRYAWVEVWPTLTGRCEVVRPDLPPGRDDNDLLRAGELSLDPFEDWHGTDEAAPGA